MNNNCWVEIRFADIEYAIDLDGMFHFKGECCNRPLADRRCGKCGDVLHLQGAYYGMMEACETCDRSDFRPAVRDDSTEGGHFIANPIPVVP